MYLSPVPQNGLSYFLFCINVIAGVLMEHSKAPRVKAALKEMPGAANNRVTVQCVEGAGASRLETLVHSFNVHYEMTCHQKRWQTEMTSFVSYKPGF